MIPEITTIIAMCKYLKENINITSSRRCFLKESNRTSRVEEYTIWSENFTDEVNNKQDTAEEKKIVNLRA